MPNEIRTIQVPTIIADRFIEICRQRGWKIGHKAGEALECFIEHLALAEQEPHQSVPETGRQVAAADCRIAQDKDALRVPG